MQIVAIVILIVVHFIGAAVLVWAMIDGAQSAWRDIWPRDDDGGGGPPRPDPPVVMPPPSFPDEYQTHTASDFSKTPV